MVQPVFDFVAFIAK